MIIGDELVAYTTKEVNLYRSSSGEIVTEQRTVSGETLLQKWSAMVMQGMLADPEPALIKTVLEVLDLPVETVYDFTIHYPAYIAKRSVAYAKALINELNKEV